MTRQLRQRRPDTTRISSTVNATNAPMIAASRRVGYREVRRRVLMQVPVPLTPALARPDVRS